MVRQSSEVKGERVVIERDGTRVSIVLQCRDEYHAMELYDELNADIERGHIGLSFGLEGMKQAGERQADAWRAGLAIGAAVEAVIQAGSLIEATTTSETSRWRLPWASCMDAAGRMAISQMPRTDGGNGRAARSTHPLRARDMGAACLQVGR